MTLLKTDILFYESERMEDTADGGGRLTGNVIQSGLENNIFKDVSRLNEVYGNISLKKGFVGVNTNDTEKYIDPFLIVSEVPENENVNITLFTTKNWDDFRSDARDYVERYLSKSAKWLGYLYEKQLTGQKVILVWQRTSIPLPSIGSVWCLTENEGLASQYEQYVRIVKMSERLQEFYDEKGTYVVRLLTIELSDALTQDFDGVAPQRYDTLLAPKANIRTTIAVDAAQYFGTKKLSSNAHIGDMNVLSSSIYTQLVPSSQAEIGVVDVNAASQNENVIYSGKGDVSFSTTAAINQNIGLYLGNGCYPGTLSITVTGGTITDDGGDLKLNASTVIGSIAYSQGTLLFNTSCPNYTSGTKTVTFKPSSGVNKVFDTAAIDILPENRGEVFTITLRPYPAPGSLIIDYMAQGKWYRLQDNGNGQIKGQESAFGSGTVNYTTGTVLLTLGALPDNYSSIIFYWGTQVATFNRSTISPPTPTVYIQLDHFPVAPNSLTITWPTSKTLTDDGLGNLSGTGGTGKVNYTAGKVEITPTSTFLGGTALSCSYSAGTPIEQTFQHPARNGQGQLVLSLQYTNIVPKTVEVEFNVLIDDYDAFVTWGSEWTPNRSNWVDPIVLTRDNGSGSFTLGIPVTGTIDYTNGIVTITPEYTCQIPKPIYSKHVLGSRSIPYANGTITYTNYRNLFDGWEYIPAPAKFPVDETGWVKVRYRATDTPQTFNGEQHIVSNVQFKLTPNYNENIIRNSIRFDFASKTYFDKDGYLFHSLNVANGSATQAGTIDYQSGLATITDWTTGTANTLTLHSLLTQITAQSVDEVTFRTAGAPIRPGSVQIRANKLDGTLITATAQTDGTFLTTDLVGTVDFQTGIVRVNFGQWVNPAGYENEAWYNELAIRPADGKIFKAVPVDPSSIIYNCVVYTYIPLDANVLGLDPVRLPFDGKVPIFKKSNLLVVHSTKKLACPNPLSSGYLVDCARERLSRVEVRDVNDLVVDPSKYTEDLDAGTVRFANPLSLTGYTQPLYVYHTVDDLVQCTDVEITGRLTLNRPLSHDYDKADSYVSSAIIIGNDNSEGGLFARWTNPFSQSTWTNVWSDTIIGSPIIPQYNYNLHPIIVENSSCIQQRWAFIFTTTTDFRIVGETLGQIGVGNINTTTAPINPNTGRPYFTLSSLGWGSGWSAGNVLRLNTYAANYPFWVARTVLQQATTLDRDDFRLAILGDKNR